MVKFHFRRFFAFVLVLVMAFCLGTASVFASEDEMTPNEICKQEIEAYATGTPYFTFEANKESYEKAVKLSDEIVGSETDHYKQAKKIFLWMKANCRYADELRGNGGTVPYYEKGHIYNDGYSNLNIEYDGMQYVGYFDGKYVGMCGDFGKMFAELCWAQNIPCLLFSGRVIQNGQEGLHLWNAFYANGSWHWADATPEITLERFDISESFYNSHYQAYSPLNRTTQSDWAKPWILDAMEKGLMDVQFVYESSPKYRIDTYDRTPYCDFRAECSRLQFAQLAVNLLEVYFNKNINEILADQGVSITPDTFSDTTNEDVLAAHALGIVSGNGSGAYNPSGHINRQEAAAILYRTAKVMGLASESADLSVFTDLDSISSWARDAVAFCKESGVMSGTTATTFAPQSNYTREQCVVTIVRLFDAAVA